MSKNMKPTVFDNEQELLKALISLHCPEGIELDPMYSKGNFYKEISNPILRFDINPQRDECKYGDAKNLPLDNNSISNMILDPPFMFGIHGKAEKYIMSTRFGIFKNFSELETLYKEILRESHRLLKRNGVLIFKCQDYTDSKTTMVHCYVWKWALEQGFYAKDLAIFEFPKRIWNSNLKQRHLRKTHSYFWVFIRKKAPKITLNG